LARARVVSVRLPAELLEEVEKLVEEGRFRSRSEAIREALRSFLYERRPFVIELACRD
jgi:Arc/MetJ-type ribon-helix-helix transcriptional regulator